MKLSRRCLLVLTIVLLSASNASALTLKLASVAPENSPWGAALNRMAADWARISGGQVTLQIYHNAIAGDEPDVVRKMRIGQIQMAVFTSSGLRLLADEVMTLNMPLLIRTEDELDHVLSEVSDVLSSSVQRARFHALVWSKGGWIRFFANAPLTSPASLRRLRLAAAADNQELLQAFRLMGYQAIPVAQNELLTSLNSGMVDAFYSSPIAAAGFQWFARAPYMLDLPVAPFIGGVVVSDRAWNRVPDHLKPQLVAAVVRHVDRLETVMEELETEAISTMQDYGLTVTELSDAQRRGWIDEFERSRDVTVGTVFDEQMYRHIQNLLTEYRR
ncbi:MAG: C4-dicarboxylate ABC transporter [Spirochaetaceae bacterium]|nr:MAG: C4-dicarboxylate ABC transporter [Spirochaetaceae bacterium]